MIKYCNYKLWEFVSRIENEDSIKYQIVNLEPQVLSYEEEKEPKTICLDNLVPTNIKKGKYKIVLDDNNKSKNNKNSEMLRNSRANNSNSLRMSKRSNLTLSK